MNQENTIQLNTLISKLDEKAIPHSREQMETHLAKPRPSAETSLLVQILSAIGVIIATLLIIFTLYAARILTEHSSLSYFICGALFLGLAFLLSGASDKKAETSPLSQQITLAGLAVGKLLLTGGLVIASGYKSDTILWVITAAMLGLTCLTYFSINSAIDRFVSPLLTMTAAYAALMHGKLLPIAEWLKFAALYAPLLAAALYLALNGNTRAIYKPLMSALLVFTSLLIPLGFGLRIDGLPHGLISAHILNLCLGAAFLATAFVIAREQAALKPDLIALTLALTILLVSYGPAHTLAALILMIIGYHKYNLPLIALGCLSFAYFLIHYYYQLNITLLEKSGLLAISGAGMLAAWAYLYKKRQQKGEDR